MMFLIGFGLGFVVALGASVVLVYIVAVQTPLGPKF